MLVSIVNKNLEKPETLDSWFSTEVWTKEPTESDLLKPFEIKRSLKAVAPARSQSVPSMPRSSAAKVVAVAVPAPEPQTPYQLLRTLIQADSASSVWLSHRGLLAKFTAIECLMDISMAPDGAVNAALKSADGYRRTIVCRPDGTSSQRVSNPDGVEIVRFTYSGQIVLPSDLKREQTLATA